MTFRRTKIVATIGPSSSSSAMLEKLIKAGINVARLNFSHGTPEEHKDRASLIRKIADKNGKYVALLGDLQGPKIRIAKFSEGKISLKAGDEFSFSVTHPHDAGTNEVVGIDYPELVKDCKVNDELLLDDGRVVMQVKQVTQTELQCVVLVGGELSNHKGINRKGGGLSAPALTAKDKADIKLAAELELDYVAVSFPRDANDMHYARKLLQEAGSNAWIVAKIERAEAVANDSVLDELIISSDAVMVARGDLCVEIGDAELVGIQKKIILHARKNNKLVITATQMMESMISNPMPTRAEVSDVANAVLDCTDAVMLSAESAAGDYPLQAVEAMNRVCLGAEKHPISIKSKHRLGQIFSRCDESVALATMYSANHFPGIKAIISLTESGYSPLIMSRIKSSVPIFAFTSSITTANRVALFRGVYPIPFAMNNLPLHEIDKSAINELFKRGLVDVGDWVILTKGTTHHNNSGGTNTMKILQVTGN